ncbi:MAG: FkbM family methyltransferase [Bacteroidales bacterium]|nr:FkbM family methyltransferase [Bacteroidales bacterium]
MKSKLYTEGFTIIIDNEKWNGRSLLNGQFNYEPHIKNWIYKYVPGKILVDIGANYGIHVLNAIRAGAKQVLAFEALSEVFSCLTETVKINNLQDKITCYPVAVGDRNGVGYICKNYDDNATINWGSKEEGEREVETRTLQEYLVGLNPADTIFLMDVEGSEFKVMSGMSDYIRLHKPRIVFEILRHVLTREVITDNIRWLGSVGYKFRLFDRPNHAGIKTGNTEELLAKIYDMTDPVMDVELIP